MKIEQKQWTPKENWKTLTAIPLPSEPQLVLAFGARPVLGDQVRFEEIKSMYPHSHIVTCSTSGEILGTEVSDGTISLTAIYFEKTGVQVSQTEITESSESFEAGKRLAAGLPKEGLAHTMIFSDGLKVNGTALVRGIAEVLGENIQITGGLAGDGSSFKETLVGVDGIPTSGKIVLVGFYGTDLKVGYGSFGGWDPFGPERLITRSKDNVLYELDNKPALELYKRYLGDRAKDLPASGLFFPLSMRITDKSGRTTEVIRTCLAINENEQSITFAGDMPEGSSVRLMKVGFESLIDGAEDAARESIGVSTETKPDLAILVSCVARKLVLSERTEEELEAVRQILGGNALLAGFYSYGEISPTAEMRDCSQLHNETMTITTFRE
ncbi:MAG: FIST N-terminal domain-containing protein [Candidatus Paceibacterota bacterium]